jgi:hypothetical protein
VTHLAHHPDGLQPAEDLLDTLSGSLAHLVGEVPGRPAIDRAVAGLLSDVRRHILVPGLVDEVGHVVPLVGTQADAPPTWNVAHHRERRLAFGASGRPRQACPDRQTGTVLHAHVTHEAQLGFLAGPFPRQQRVWIGGRFVRPP